GLMRRWHHKMPAFTEADPIFDNQIRPLAPAVVCGHERVRQLDERVDVLALVAAHQLRLRDQLPYTDGRSDRGDRRRPPVADHGRGVEEAHDVLPLPRALRLAELLPP